MVGKRGFEISCIFLSPISSKTVVFRLPLPCRNFWRVMKEKKIFVNILYVRSMIPFRYRNTAPPTMIPSLSLLFSNIFLWTITLSLESIICSKCNKTKTASKAVCPIQPKLGCSVLEFCCGVSPLVSLSHNRNGRVQEAFVNIKWRKDRWDARVGRIRTELGMAQVRH